MQVTGMLSQRLLLSILKCNFEHLSLHAPALARPMSAAKTTTPPPDAARGATADLCDVFLPDPVDLITERKVQIMDPIFQ